jgi:hypothetical protein
LWKYWTFSKTAWNKIVDHVHLKILREKENRDTEALVTQSHFTAEWRS